MFFLTGEQFAEKQDGNKAYGEENSTKLKNDLVRNVWLKTSLLYSFVLLLRLLALVR